MGSFPPFHVSMNKNDNSLFVQVIHTRAPVQENPEATVEVGDKLRMTYAKVKNTHDMGWIERFSNKLSYDVTVQAQNKVKDPDTDFR